MSDLPMPVQPHALPPLPVPTRGIVPSEPFDTGEPFLNPDNIPDVISAHRDFVTAQSVEFHDVAAVLQGPSDISATDPDLNYARAMYVELGVRRLFPSAPDPTDPAITSANHPLAVLPEGFPQDESLLVYRKALEENPLYDQVSLRPTGPLGVGNNRPLEPSLFYPTVALGVEEHYEALRDYSVESAYRVYGEIQHYARSIAGLSVANLGEMGAEPLEVACRILAKVLVQYCGVDEQAVDIYYDQNSISAVEYTSTGVTAIAGPDMPDPGDDPFPDAAIPLASGEPSAANTEVLWTRMQTRSMAREQARLDRPVAMNTRSRRLARSSPPADYPLNRHGRLRGGALVPVYDTATAPTSVQFREGTFNDWIKSIHFRNLLNGRLRYGLRTHHLDSGVLVSPEEVNAVLMNTLPGALALMLFDSTGSINMRAQLARTLRLTLGSLFIMQPEVRSAMAGYIDHLRMPENGGWGRIRVGMQMTVTLARFIGGSFYGDANRHTEERMIILDSNVFYPGEDSLDKVGDMLKNALSIFSERDLGESGFRMISIREVELTAVHIVPSPAGEWIQTPPCLFVKKAILNVRNTDNKCAMYAYSLGILDKDGQRPVNYEMQSTWTNRIVGDWTGIQMPMEMKDWRKVERRNPDVGVFIYAPVMDDEQKYLKTVEVLRVPSNPEAKRFVQLMLLEKEGREHYVTITNMSRLMNTQNNRHRVRCPYCTSVITGNFETHIKDCSTVCTSRTVTPEQPSTIHFQRIQNSIELPVFMTADFECRMEDVEDPQTGDKLRVHKPVSVALHVHNALLSRTEVALDCPSFMFDSDNDQTVIDELLRTMKTYSARCETFTQACLQETQQRTKEQQPVNAQEMLELVDTKCFYCDEDVRSVCPGFVRAWILQQQRRPNRRRSHRRRRRHRSATEAEEEGEDEEEEEGEEEEEMIDPDVLEAVRLLESLHESPRPATPTLEVLHCFHPFTGEERGYCHAFCQKMVLSKLSKSLIPCYFHNATGYDMKLIISRLGSSTVPDLNVSKAFLIAQSSERVKRLDICGLSILDSMSHLGSSLEQLVKRLTADYTKPENCPTIARGILEHYGPRAPWRMLTRKGIFPYAWLTSHALMDHPELPPPEAFKNDLNGQEVSRDDYRYAQEVWDAFQCRTFRDYHNLYLWVDVWSLTDVMVNYAAFGRQNYNLDPTRYASSPAYAFDAMLKTTKSKFDILTDMDMVLFFERSIHGGISLAAHPYVTVDNPDLRFARGEDTEPRETDQYFGIWDENGQYAGAMTQYLPCSNFAWHPAPALFKLSSLEAEPSAQGILLEVDLEFPDDLHDKFNDLPPAPERMKVDRKHLSDEQRKAIEDRGSTATYKLVPHLLPHERYVVHGYTLHLYMRLGVKVTKVHRILTFSQARSIKSFVELNVKLRQEASARKDLAWSELAKGMNNWVYGKFLENLRKHGEWSIVPLSETRDPANAEHFRRLLSTNRLSQMEVRQSVAMLRFNRSTIVMDRPIYIGSAILSLAKRSIYSFWYETVRVIFPDARLVYTDTDSIFCVVRSSNIFEDCLAYETKLNGGVRPTTPGSGIFDWSSLDKDVHERFYSKHNDKVLGKFKWDMGSKIPTTIMALRSKMYSVEGVYDPATHSLTKRKCAAKGVPRSCHSTLDYWECLFDGVEDQVSFCRIGGKNMQLETLKQQKVGLTHTLHNDKRFIREKEGLPEGQKDWESFALGHVKLRGLSGCALEDLAD